MVLRYPFRTFGPLLGHRPASHVGSPDDAGRPPFRKRLIAARPSLILPQGRPWAGTGRSKAGWRAGPSVSSPGRSPATSSSAAFIQLRPCRLVALHERGPRRHRRVGRATHMDDRVGNTIRGHLRWSGCRLHRREVPVSNWRRVASPDDARRPNHSSPAVASASPVNVLGQVRAARLVSTSPTTTTHVAATFTHRQISSRVVRPSGFQAFVVN